MGVNNTRGDTKGGNEQQVLQSIVVARLEEMVFIKKKKNASSLLEAFLKITLCL